jgi:energy-coupling factor transporter ATP-binding protein EcfA2
MLEYFKEYRGIPKPSVVLAETNVDLVPEEVTPDQLEYVTDSIEQHCQEMAMQKAIYAGADELGEDVPDMGSISQAVKEALLISIDKDIGIDYFKDPSTRLMMMQQHIDARSIGWISVDMVTEKIKRGELVLFAGNSGSGKSVFLANIFNNMAASGLNALMISLELGEDLVAKRVDGISTGIQQSDIFGSVDEITKLLSKIETGYGTMTIKKMPARSTNTNHIRAYLMEYELEYGHKPDVICVDYLDLLETTVRVQGNVFDIDKVKSEELREIFQDYNAYGFTASQLNRGAIDTAEKNQGDIAGGLSKINTCDIAFAITRDEVQKDNGEVWLTPIKLRNSVSSEKEIVLYWDDKTLKITDKNTQSNKNKSGSRETANDRLKRLMGNKGAKVEKDDIEGK